MKRKTIRKIFWIWEFEKEEQWLNGMAQSGWVLDDIGFCTYHFTECIPGDYTLRLEMHPRDDDYIRFLQEMDTEYIGRMLQWIYLRRKREFGEFDLFSDVNSKITHLDKIGRTLSIVGAANLLIGLVNSFNPAVNIGWLNLLCATFLMYALGRIHGKKEALKRERLLHE